MDRCKKHRRIEEMTSSKRSTIGVKMSSKDRKPLGKEDSLNRSPRKPNFGPKNVQSHGVEIDITTGRI
jgi:hypothetical protein